HHGAKARVEELLFASGLAVTVLQPTAYMQNLLPSWRTIVAEGVLRVPYPIATRLSLVDLDDVAAVAAMVLTEPAHAGASYELAGTPALRQDEVAAALSAALGRAVRAEEAPIETLTARIPGAYQRDALARMLAYYARHGFAGNPNVLRWLLGRPAIDVGAFARRIGGTVDRAMAPHS